MLGLQNVMHVFTQHTNNLILVYHLACQVLYKCHHQYKCSCGFRYWHALAQNVNINKVNIFIQGNILKHERACCVVTQYEMQIRFLLN